MTLRFVALAAALVLAAAPGAALAWGSFGHRIIGVVAMRALPAEVPAFLRTPQAAADVGELSREPDRSKDGGRVHDSDRDPAHFVDVEDDGRILGGPSLAALPPTRADYETALRAAGTDSWKAGYLPYAVVDRQQQLARDFAYWRVLVAAERNPGWRAHRAWFREDRRRREALIFDALGELSHFVADGSQPLHVSAHYNGWGDYPNPNGYTRAKVHAMFEGDFVRRNVGLPQVAAEIAPLRAVAGPVEPQVAAYLAVTAGQVEPFYALEKAGGFRPGDARGKAFAVARLAAGAAMLRDLVVEAWRASPDQKVGWSPVPVADVLSGKTDPYGALMGVD
ncbi:S1/P1 Nuclease [Phenylobacterium sp.]|uniref:S1/P1 Nuclease n=1 Tax=Phenylobacterium sp. TaxID=1871053 RepID=UPI002F41BA46